MCNNMLFYFSDTAMRRNVIVYVINWYVNLETVIATDIITYWSKMKVENVASFGVIISDAIIYQ